MTRRQALAAAGVSVAAVGGLACAEEREPARRRGRAFPARRPQNVLLVIVDTLRADHVGCYGNESISTPHMDGLARDGFRFTRVFPEAMPTVPARRSLMTGRRIFPFRGWQRWRGLGRTPGWAPIMPKERTLATTMRRAGYWTGYVTDTPSIAWSSSYIPFRDSFDSFVKVDGQLLKPDLTDRVRRDAAVQRLPGYMQGDDVYIDQQRQYMAANGAGPDGRVREEDSATAGVFSAGMAALDRAARRRRPFFLVVDAFDAHEPWAVPDRYLDLYRPVAGGPPEIGDIRYGPGDQWQPSELERLRMTYAASVTMIDAWIGRLLERLETRGVADSTVVLLVSDHGILLGERDWVGKSAWLLHPEMTHVPLIIRDPDGRGAGGRSDWFASTHDVAPTLMSLGPGRQGDFEGADLTPLLAGRTPPEERPYAYGGYSNDSFIRDDKWALVIDNRAAGRRLYDLEADPGERTDLSGERADVVRELYGRLRREIGGPPPFYTQEQLNAEPRRLRGT